MKNKMNCVKPVAIIFSGLKVLHLNRTLKKLPELSHTEGLLKVSKPIMEKKGIDTGMLRPVDYEIAHGYIPLGYDPARLR